MYVLSLSSSFSHTFVFIHKSLRRLKWDLHRNIHRILIFGFNIFLRYPCNIAKLYKEEEEEKKSLRGLYIRIHTCTTLRILKYTDLLKLSEQIEKPTKRFFCQSTVTCILFELSFTIIPLWIGNMFSFNSIHRNSITAVG